MTKVQKPVPESQFLQEFQDIVEKQNNYKCFIGCGYYNTITPPILVRSLVENPVWYTSYTPYQAEISQGRLESLLNFQTMICELTGFEIANASLLDEGTAAAEAMLFAFNSGNGKKKKFFVSEACFPQTIEVVKTRAMYLGFEVVVGKAESFDFEANSGEIFGALFQSPDNLGLVKEFKEINSILKKNQIISILGLTLLKPPKEDGFDVAVGNSQRFGVPIGFGGPHAAFFATSKANIRKMPGRIIGVSKDVHGNTAYRMTLQTREQHIRREKATSNICTAQALLANVAAMYSLFHGPVGLKKIARRVNSLAQVFAGFLSEWGYRLEAPFKENCGFFDTVVLRDLNRDVVYKRLFESNILARKIGKDGLAFSFDETTTIEDVFLLLSFFNKENKEINVNDVESKVKELPAGLQRKSAFMKQKDITKFPYFSFQPNSGAQGEYAGLLTILAYHKKNSNGQRKVCLIPTSSHGTNPASATLAGMKVVPVLNDKEGYIDIVDLKSKAEKHKNELGALMITYPSTYGVFEENIKDCVKIVHDFGGLVYMDGANMNAQVGWTSPGFIGADVCHLNLHKTFSIPHGGGGPDGNNGCGSVSSAPFSSASILSIPYAYIKQMGTLGLRRATGIAILNANYLMSRLEKYYKVSYVGKKGKCAHEFIIDFRPIKEKTGISEEDACKRLMDFGFHAPTMSFPVPGTLMIEPTESEDKEELDRFAEALIKIHEEIKKVESGEYDKKDNPLKNAPHTQFYIVSETWNHPYTREEAAFPLPWVKTRHKVWPSIGRVDNVYGDKNVFCTCPNVEEYIN